MREAHQKQSPISQHERKRQNPGLAQTNNIVLLFVVGQSHHGSKGQINSQVILVYHWKQSNLRGVNLHYTSIIERLYKLQILSIPLNILEHAVSS